MILLSVDWLKATLTVSGSLPEPPPQAVSVPAASDGDGGEEDQWGGGAHGHDLLLDHGRADGR